jgi:hypothetical protein
MVLQTSLMLCALVVLSQSKAVVTNRCPTDVFLWSIPSSSGYAENIRIQPHGQYDETFHRGTGTTPDIAIKISPEPYGIYVGRDEINLTYTVDPADMSKVWVNLPMVRGNSFHDATLYTCNGPYKEPYVPIRQCSLNDNIELVLCGTERSMPEEDQTSVDILVDCVFPKLQEHYGNKTQHRRARACHSRVAAPKMSQQQKSKGPTKVEQKSKPKDGTKKQDKAQAPKDERPKHRAGDDARNEHAADDCKCKWTGEGWKCTCDEFQERNKTGHHCVTTGEFQHCFNDNIANWVVTPNSFTEKYAGPLLRLVWLSACNISAHADRDCVELKDALKAAYPDIDRVEWQYQAHNGTDKDPVMRVAKSPAGDTEKSAEGKRTDGKEKACQDLAALFPDLPHHTCTDLINAVRLKLGGKKINIKAAKEHKASGRHYRPEAGAGAGMA